MDQSVILNLLEKQRAKGKLAFPNCFVKGRKCTSDLRPFPGVNFLYGWHCGMGFGSGVEVLDAIDACAYLHDGQYWKAEPDSPQGKPVYTDLSNHLGFIAAITWVSAYGRKEAEEARLAVLTSAVNLLAVYIAKVTPQMLIKYLPDRYVHGGRKQDKPELVRELVLTVNPQEAIGRIMSMENTILGLLSGVTAMVQGVGEGAAKITQTLDQTIGALFGPRTCGLGAMCFDPFDPDNPQPPVTNAPRFGLAERSDGVVSTLPAANTLTYIGPMKSEGLGPLGPYYNYPKASMQAAKLQLVKVGGGDGPLQDWDIVHIVTQESNAGEYCFLGAWGTRALYYWKNGGEKQLQWQINKGDRSVDPIIRTGDRIALQSCHYTGQYLAREADDYLTTRRSCSFWSIMEHM